MEIDVLTVNRDRPSRSAADMVNDCFRHQHPEAYGGQEIPEPAVPSSLRCGDDPVPPPSPEIPEGPMGDPEALILPA